MKRNTILLITGFISLALLGCGDHSHHDHDHHGHDHHDHGSQHESTAKEHKGHKGHAHVAPHGGCLLVLGQEFAHLELLLDAKSGRLKGYILDGEAVRGVRISQPTLKIMIKTGREDLEVVLKAEENELSGEKVGDSSVFSSTEKNLIGVEHFDAVIPELVIKGTHFHHTSFHYPEGNH